MIAMCMRCKASQDRTSWGSLGAEKESEENKFFGIPSMNVAPFIGPVCIDGARGMILGMVAFVVFHSCCKILLHSCAHRCA